jgi:hypothetical protein
MWERIARYSLLDKAPTAKAVGAMEREAAQSSRMEGLSVTALSLGARSPALAQPAAYW